MRKKEAGNKRPESKKEENKNSNKGNFTGNKIHPINAVTIGLAIITIITLAIFLSATGEENES